MKGIFPHRLCHQIQKQYLTNLLQLSKNKLKENKNQRIHWVNFFVGEKHYLFENDQEQQQKLIDFSKNLGDQVFPNQNLFVASAGIVVNPADTSEDQPFHLDYVDMKQIFIPYVHLTSQNSTQWISSEKDFALDAKLFAGANEKQLIQKNNLDFVIVHQIACKPFTILKLNSGTIHRGIKNKAKQDRPMFYIVYSPKKVDLNQSQSYDFTKYQDANEMGK